MIIKISLPQIDELEKILDIGQDPQPRNTPTLSTNLKEA